MRAVAPTNMLPVAAPHAPGTEPEPPAHGRRAWLLALSVALFAVALWRAHPAVIGAQLLRVGFPRALWLLAPYAAGTAVGALPWGLLLPAASRPSLRAVVAGRFVASSANALLPFFGLAGEPARLLWLEPRERARGLAAIVLDRVLYNSSNGVLLLAGAVVGAWATPLPRSVTVLAGAAALVTLGVTLVGLELVVRFGVGAAAQRWLRRLFGALYGERDFGAEVDRALVTLLAARRRVLVPCVALHVLARSVIALEIWLALRFLGVPFTAADVVVLAAVPIGLSLVFSSIPSQLGVHEGGLGLVTAALGFGPALGVTLVLLQRFRQLSFAALVPLLLRDAHARASAARPAN